jgi:hypothetical protein
LAHTGDVREYGYVAAVRSGSSSTTPCAASTCLPVATALHQLRRVPRLLISQSHGLYINYAVCRDYSSPGRTGSTSTTPCATTTHLPVARVLHQLRPEPRLLVVQIAPPLLRLCRASGRAISMLDFSSVGRTGSRHVPGHFVVRCDYPSRGRNGYTSTTPRVRVPRHVAWLVARLVVDYFDYVASPVALARRAARRRLLRLPQARRRLLRLRRASGCLGTSRGSSHGSSSTTSPRVGSSSTTSPTPRLRVPRHVVRLVTRLVVDYFASRRLVVDYFASRRLVVDYFAYAAPPGASARRAARRQLLRLAQARRRLLRLRRASGCLGMSRGSSSTTSPRAG